MREFLFGCRFFATRLVVVLVFLFGFYNPTKYNYVDWVLAEPRDALPGVKILVGILFLCALVYLAMTTHKTMGRIGLVLGIAVMAAAFALMYTNVHVNWTNSTMLVVGQVFLALLFAFGMSAANLNRRISGQVTTNQAGPVQVDGGHHHA